MPSPLARERARLARLRAAIARTKRRIARLLKKPDLKGPWMPGIVHDPVTSIGPFTTGAPKGVLHTTEGLSFSGADSTLKGNGTEPHFLIGTTGTIKQYRPLTDAGTSLEHRSGTVETNRAHAVQIEVCGFAAKPDWPTVQKKAVARVMAYCHANGVPLKSSVHFADAAHVTKLSDHGWLTFSGWCGHQHVPNNSHT